MESTFEMDLNQLREQARNAARKALQCDGPGEFELATIKILDAALATEWICVLRYSQHAIAASGINSLSVAEHFREHAAQELEHAHKLAVRIGQLGGEPHMNPRHMADAAHSEYKECDSLVGMIEENLFAEHIAVHSYRQAIEIIGDRDPTTRRLIEEILATEEEHADEMAQLLKMHGTRH